MAKHDQLLTAGKFSSQAGIPVATVNRLIRDGKIKAVKKSGKWMINPNQLSTPAVQEVSRGGEPSTKKKPSKPPRKKAAAQAKKAPTPQKQILPVTEKSFTIAEFAEMTYLTKFGVMDWLKKGLLKGQQDEKGDWLIDATNLEVANVKRLVREDRVA